MKCDDFAHHALDTNNWVRERGRTIIVRAPDKDRSGLEGDYYGQGGYIS